MSKSLELLKVMVLYWIGEAPVVLCKASAAAIILVVLDDEMMQQMTESVDAIGDKISRRRHRGEQGGTGQMSMRMREVMLLERVVGGKRQHAESRQQQLHLLRHYFTYSFKYNNESLMLLCVVYERIVSSPKNRKEPRTIEKGTRTQVETTKITFHYSVGISMFYGDGRGVECFLEFKSVKNNCQRTLAIFLKMREKGRDFGNWQPQKSPAIHRHLYYQLL